MYQGDAAAALDLYDGVFADFRILERDAGEDGKIRMARAELGGHRINLIDTPPVHDFTFTPSVSFFVEMHSEEALDAAFEKLSDGGKVLMPLDGYDFSPRFGWVQDPYGVSWQLSLVE